MEEKTLNQSVESSQPNVGPLQPGLECLRAGVQFSEKGEYNEAISQLSQAFRYAERSVSGELYASSVGVRVFANAACELARALCAVGQRDQAGLTINYAIERLCRSIGTLNKRSVTRALAKLATFRETWRCGEGRSTACVLH